MAAPKRHTRRAGTLSPVSEDAFTPVAPPIQEKTVMDNSPPEEVEPVNRSTLVDEMAKRYAPHEDADLAAANKSAKK